MLGDGAPGSSRTRFDAVTLEVLWTRMIGAVDEAAKALRRTSFSTLVNESNDFALVLTDPAGRSLVQNTESIPSFIGTLPVTVGHFVERFGLAGIGPGDILVTNNPWIATGHLNDITLAKPIFREGRIVAFAASTAHAPDIGGKVRSVEAREVFEEGFHIPPMKLVSAGEPDRTLLALLRAAVRTPDQTEGDLWAQVTGLDLVERRLGELMDEYGLADLDGFAAEIHGRCENAMRAAIRALPDGDYTYGFHTDGLDEPFTYRCRVTVAGDRVTVDYTGTSAQVDRAINCPITYTFAMTAYALKCALLPDLANNDGIFRCVELVAPEGTLVNPRFPAAVGGRMATGHYLPLAVLGALAPVLPEERLMAACGSPLWSMIQTGVRADGRTYANVLFFNGGMGATGVGDGQSAYSWPSNISNVPVELVERNAPLVVRHKRLREGSGGAGRHRGGLGQEVHMEVVSETPIGVIFMAERCRFPAPGAKGGEAGALGHVLIDGRPADYRANHVLHKGQTITLATPGGGGLGPASERPPGEAADDVRNGLSIEGRSSSVGNATRAG
jgi:N-methylhydantoinase B